MSTNKYSVMLIAAILVAASAQAQNRFWGAGSGDWSTAANWGGDVPDTSVEVAYFAGVGNAINLDADYTTGGMRANFGAEGGTNTLSGTGTTLTINGNAANVLGFANQAGGSGGTMILNGNMVVNNTPGGANNLTQVRNDNSSGNSTVFSPSSSLTLNTPLVMLSGAGGTIELNCTLDGAGFLVVQNNNSSFNTGHNSSALNNNINFWGTNRKLTVNGGTVLSSSQKFSIQGTGSELELNGANSINGANLEVLSTHAFLLDVNSDQNNMGAISLVDGVLTIDVDAGVADLFFADSSAIGWGTGSVVINGFQEGVIKFGSDASGLSVGQLAQISGDTYGLTETGYLTVIPEPATIGLLAIGGLGLFVRRRMMI